jgi:TetR/AcrR family transcriptional regulator
MDPATDIAAGARSILDAATAAFAQGGFDSVSIADIARAAGVSKANVFHHFKSKEALHQEVLRLACTDHAEFAEGLLARDALSSADKLRALVAYDFEDGYAKPRDTHLVIREVMNTGCCTGRDLVEPFFVRNFDAIVAVIRQGQTRGEFRADVDAPTAALMMGGTFVMFFQNRHQLRRLLGMSRQPTPAECAERVSAALLGGVLAPVPAAAVRAGTVAQPKATARAAAPSNPKPTAARPPLTRKSKTS